MSSTWSIPDLLRYSRTRFPLWRFGPLALFLAVAAGAMDVRVLLALAFLFVFRLADDLADRRRDAQDHPDRVLVRADVRPFLALLLLSGAGSTLLTAWLLPWPRWVEFAALAALFLLWYAAAHRHPPSPLLGGLVVLLKYPAFVYLVSDPEKVKDPCLLAGPLVLVYACFAAHEIIHDRRLWREPGAASCLVLALVVMTAAALLPTTRLTTSIWYLLGCVAPGCLLLTCVWRHRHQSGLWPYGVFLVSFVWIVCGFLLLPLL